MALFFIDTETGRVATGRQLTEAGVAEDADSVPRPWFRIQGSGDATTLWHAVMRKATRGVYIGALVIRHSDHHAFLLGDGWEEVPPDQIGPGEGRSEVTPGPWTA